AMDALVKPIYERIAQFMLKRKSVVPRDITLSAKEKAKEEKTKEESRADRVSRLYDRLLEESDAVKQYFKIMQDQTLLQKQLDKHKPLAADFWKDVWGIKTGTPSLDDLQVIMMRDYVAISGQTGPAVSGKTYPDPKKMFKDIGGDAPFVGRKPEN